MKFLLHLFTFKRFSKTLTFFFLLMGLLFAASVVRAQAIVETFEENAWSSASRTAAGSTTMTLTTGATTFTSSYSGFSTVSYNIGVSASTNQTISSYSANNASTTTTTRAPASSGNWTWVLWGGAGGTTGASVLTGNTNWGAGGGASIAHSKGTSIGFQQQGGYLATPVMANGITTVTFWVGQNNIYVGLRTNFTGTYATAGTSYPLSGYPTGGGSASTGFAVSNIFSIQSTCYAGGAPMNQYTFTVAGTNSTVPGQLVFMADGGGGGQVYIDDIVINSNAGCTAPTITAQPSTGTQSVCVGGTLTALGITATGTSLTYQWYSNPTSSTTGGTAVSTGTGPTTASFTPSTSTASALYYYCIVSSSTCTTTSTATGLITVNATSVGGTATATASSVCNSSGTTTVALTGNTGSTIQWQQAPDNSTWSTVSGGSGGTTATYTTPTLASGLYYRASVTNTSCSAAYSSSALVAVNQSNAGDGVYTSGAWTSGQNDNTNGLGAWSLTGGGSNSGFFTGTSVSTGSGNTSNIDVNSLSFGLYANSGALASAARPFSSAFSVGNSVSFAMQNGYDNGTVGFSLYNASGNALMELYFVSGQSFYTLHDGSGSNATTIAYSVNGFNISIAYTSASGNGSYTLAVTPVSGGSTTYYSGTFISGVSGGQVPGQIRFFNSNAGSGGAYNLYCNSLALNTPIVYTQPSTSAQTICSGGSLTPLTVAAAGTNLTYQWYYNTSNSNSGGTAVSTGTGYTSNTFTPVNSTASAYYYYCKVSGNCSSSATSNTSGLITVSTGPSATTVAADLITTTTATINGSVNANGTTTTNYFNWGTSTSYSNTNVAATPATSTGSSATADSLHLTGLTVNTLYDYDATGTNGSCTGTGSNLTFTTLSNAPTIGSASSITSSGFTANWTAPSNAGSATYTYTVQASTSSSFATIAATGSNIASGTTTYAFTTLSASTTYYFRVEAVNAGGNSAWSATSAAVITSATDTDPSSPPSVGNNENITTNQYVIESVQQSKYLYDNSGGTSGTFLTYDNGTPSPTYNTKYAWYFTYNSYKGGTYSIQNVSTGNYMGYFSGSYVGNVGDGCTTENTNRIDLDNATTFNSTSQNKTLWFFALVSGTAFSTGSIYTLTNQFVDSAYGYFLNTQYSPSSSYQVLVSAANCNATGREFGLTTYTATPDLQVTNVTTSLSGNAQNGVPFTATATIINNGVLAIASGTRMKIKFTFEGTIDSLIYTGGLGAGASTTLSAVTITPNQLSAGSNLIAIVNSNYAIAEYNYSNNSDTIKNIAVVAPTYNPVVVTNAADLVTTTTATINGSVNAQGYSSTAYFNYGTSTSPYTTLGAGATPGTITGSSATPDSLLLTGLTPNTLYNFKDSAVNTNGNGAGSNLTFTTLPTAPTVGTGSSATTTGFTANWTAPTGIGSATYTYTVQASTSSSFASIAATGSSIASGTLSYAFTTLSSATTYYYRVYAVNAQGSSAASGTSAAITTLVSAGTACTTGSGSSASPGIIVDAASAPSGPSDPQWANAPSNTITVQAVNNYGSPVSGSTWQGMFDGTNLYVLINAKDNTPNSACNNASPYQYDGVEIYVDGANGKQGNMTTSGQQASQWAINYGCTGTSNITGTNDQTTGVTYSISTNSGTGYSAQITVPWSSVYNMQNFSGSTISALSTIGFDASLNDNQTYASGRAQQLAWIDNNSGGSGFYQVPNDWGTVTLSVCAPPALSKDTTLSITTTSATLQDTVKSLNGGGSLVSGSSGVEYGTSSSLSSPTVLAYSGTPTVGSAFNVSATGLSPQTHYYYEGYATRTNFGTNVAGVSVIDSFYTLSNLATAQASFGTIGKNCSTDTLRWTAATFPGTGATANGYILIRNGSGTATAAGIINGVAPGSLILTGGSLVTTITSGATVTYTDASLTSGTTYSYKLVPYTWDNGHAGTYNYDTASASTVSVTIIGATGVPTSSTPSAVCTGSSAIITGSGGANATSYTFWTAAIGGSQITGSTTPPGTVSGNVLTTPTTLAAGSYIYYVEGEDGTGCASATRQAVTVTINATSIGGTATATASSVCNGATTTITLSGNTGSTIQWQDSSATTSGSWVSVSGGSGSTTTTYTTAALAYGTYFRASVNNGSCSVAYSTSALVSVNQSTAGDGIYTGGSWTTGQNDNANGFGAWALTGVTGGYAGFFTGTSSATPSSTSNIDVNSLSWGMYANTSNTASAVRPFTGNTLSVGSTLSFNMQDGYINSGGTVGFSLYNVSGNALMELYFGGGTTYYVLHDGAGTPNTTVPFTSNGLNIAIAYTSSSGNGTYSIAITPAGGTTTYYNAHSFISGVSGGQVPASIRFFDYNAGSGSNYDQFFNSLVLNNPVIAVTPSTSTQTLCAGATPTNLTVTAYGSSLSYQWQQSTTGTSSWTNVSGGSGATTATYTPQTSTAGTLYYQCVVTGGNCSATVTSNASGAVTINALPTALVLTGSTVCSGITTTITSSTSVSGINYQLYNSSALAQGSAIAGSGSALTWSSIAAGTGYYVIGTNSATGCASAQSNAVNVVINALPTITLGANPSICYSTGTQAANLSYTATTGSPTTYNISGWSGGSFSNVTNATLPGTPIVITVPASTAAGTYTATLTVANSTCTSSNYSISVAITAQTLTLSSGAGTNNQTLCENNMAITNITYTVGGLSTGATVSGLPTGVTGSYSSGTFTISGTPTVSGTYSYTVTTSGSSCSAATASGTITVSADTWTGASSTAWNTSANWSCGVPLSFADVNIPSTGITNYPVLGGSTTINNISIGSGSTLNINGDSLTVNGSFSGSGNLIGSSTSSLIVGSPTAGTINFTGSGDTLKNLTLTTNAVATLGSPLNIASWQVASPGTLTVGSSATLNTGSGLTLKSNDSSTSLVAAIPEVSGVAQGTINGSVTIERDVHSSVNVPTSSENGSNNVDINNGLRAWRLLTAPIAGGSGTQTVQGAWQNSGIVYNASIASTQGVGTLITGPGANKPANGLDTVSGVSMYSWNAGSQSFIAATNTLGPISDGNYGGSNSGNTGYFLFVRGDRNPATVDNPNNGGVPINNTVLNPTGTLITGRQVYNVIKAPGTGNNNNSTLIGNPYASPVDLGALVSSLVNVKPVFNIWDPSLNQVGGFVTIDFTGGTPPVYTPNPPTVTQYVQSGQAFFVAGSSTSSDGTITFDESDKVNANNNYVFRPQSGGVSQSLRSNLYLLNADSSVTLADGNLAQYASNFSNSFNSEDIVKLPNLTETFGLLLDNALLSIERQPLVVAKDTLFFNLTKTTQRSYQFQLTASGLGQAGLAGYLKDSYTGDSTALNLNGTTMINFTIDANTGSQNANRFMVVFEQVGTPLPVTFVSIKAAQQSGGIQVSWGVQNELNIKSYVVEKSVDGKTFTAAATVAASGLGQYGWLDKAPGEGGNYYRVYSIGKDGSIEYSQVVEVKIGAASPAIAVYPNPIKDGIINLEFTNMPQGAYVVKMLTNLGQILTTKTINHAGGSASETMPFDRELARGAYQLEIIAPDNTKTSINLAY